MSTASTFEPFHVGEAVADTTGRVDGVVAGFDIIPTKRGQRVALVVRGPNGKLRRVVGSRILDVKRVP